MKTIIILGLILSLIISGFLITDILEDRKDTKESNELIILSASCCKIPFTIFRSNGGTIKALILK